MKVMSLRTVLQSVALSFLLVVTQIADSTDATTVTPTPKPTEIPTSEKPSTPDRAALLRKIIKAISKTLVEEDVRLHKQNVSEAEIVKGLTAAARETLKGEVLADVIALAKIDNQPDATAADFQNALIISILSNLKDTGDIAPRSGSRNIMYAAGSASNFFKSLLRG